MCEVTKEMVKLWKMDKYDWMYYKVSDETPFTYHHLFIPTRKDPKRTIENGAVLCGNCKLPSAGGSHAYIHIIEKIDPDRFDAISLILAEVNFQGFKNFCFSFGMVLRNNLFLKLSSQVVVTF